MSGEFIGLGGRFRSGKDAVADHLVDEHDWVKVGMSDVLHQALLAIAPFIPVNAQPRGPIPGFEKQQWGDFVRYSHLIDQVGYVEAKKNPEVRQLLQRLGTEVGRKMLGENTWVDRTGRNIAGLLAAGNNVALTGVRYPNELQMVQDIGGTTVWVERPGNVLPPELAAHDSENSVFEEDFMVTVLNDGTIVDLHNKSTDLINNLKELPAMSATETDTIPAQRVLLDDTVIVQLAQVQPADPNLVRVESYVTGPFTVTRERISPVI